MERRKVQRLGPSTLALTLPAPWSTEHGVKKGDELTIHPGDGLLTITTDSTDRSAVRATLHVAELDPGAVERAIIAQYVLGRRVISIENDDQPIPREITDAVYRAETQLMGLGVIEETTTHLTIRCSVDPGDFLLDNLIARLERTGRTMRDEAIQAVVAGNVDLAERAYNRERQANRIFVLLLRLIFTASEDPTVARALGQEDALPLIGYRSVAKNLELVADDAEDIARIVIEREGDIDATVPLAEGLLEFADHVNELSRRAIDAVIERDFLATVEVRRQYGEVKDPEGQFHPRQRSNAVSSELVDVYASLTETAKHAMHSAEVAANLSLRTDSAHLTTE